jgi:hypothetical protein
VVDQIRHWLSGYRPSASPIAIALAVGVPLLSFVVGVLVIVGLPADYFVRPRPRGGFWQSHGVVRLFLLAAKNLAGLLLLLVGFVAALPLVPGPGILFMLIGIGLLDFPGKRALELRLLRQRRVLDSVNRLRARFGRPPVLTSERRSAGRGEP